MQLTEKQAKFVDAYRGNIRDAAVTAGLTYGYARQLMMSPHIQDALQQREPAATSNNAFRTRADRQAWWASLMADETLPIQHRLRASELLARSEGDFLERREETEEKFILQLNFEKVAELRAQNANQSQSKLHKC